MTFTCDKLTAATCAAVTARCERVRAGVDIGFSDASAPRFLRGARSGVWMSVAEDAGARDALAVDLDPKTVLMMGCGGELPFDDRQFDAVVLATELFERRGPRLEKVIQETHRILQGGGCLFFTVPESADEPGWTARAIYELLRNGFDVVGLKRPPWWCFGLTGRRMTVCARRKNWKNRGVPIVGAAMPVSSAMLSPRTRIKL